MPADRFTFQDLLLSAAPVESHVGAIVVRLRSPWLIPAHSTCSDCLVYVGLAQRLCDARSSTWDI